MQVLFIERGGRRFFLQRSWAVSYSTSFDSDGRRGRRENKIMYKPDKITFSNQENRMCGNEAIFS